MTTPDEIPDMPPTKPWLECLVNTFGGEMTGPDEFDVRIDITSPEETLSVIERLGCALVVYFEHQIPDPNIRHQVETIRNTAGDAFFYLVDEGDHG